MLFLVRFVVCFLGLVVCLGTAGCDTSDDASSDGNGGDQPEENWGQAFGLQNEPDTPACDADRLPIVFVHGYLENGDAFSTQTMRFGANGYCIERIYCYDWNGVIRDYDREMPRFIAYLEAVMAETGADRVELIGHSFGGDLGYLYVTDPELALHVAHYVHMAGYPYETIPTDVPTINISSKGDYVVGPTTLEGVDNVVYDHLDHLQVATSPETFEVLYSFFNDGENPTTTDLVSEKTVRLSGKTVVFALNDTVADVEVRIYEVDPATGERIHPDPEGVYRSNSGGYWGPFEGDPNAYYEFACLDISGYWPALRYYREPFPRSNNKVYFRVYPAPDTPLGILFRLMPSDDAYALFSYMNINQALIHGRDTLWVDGYDLATEQIAPAQNTTLVIVFNDANANGVSDGEMVESPIEGMFFIRFFDLLVDTEVRRSIPLQFNGRWLSVPNWKSQSEGLSIAVFN